MKTATIRLPIYDGHDTLGGLDEVRVVVMAAVDGFAMVHRAQPPSHPFVVYEVDLKYIQDPPLQPKPG